MFELFDTVNDRLISRHRTMEAAIAADQRVRDAIGRLPGGRSYLPTEIRRNGVAVGADGQPLRPPACPVCGKFHSLGFCHG